MGRLSDRVVILTGASSGIGAESARMLGREGARIVMVARRADRLTAICDEIAATGSGEALIVAADVTAPGDRKRIVDEALSRFGRIDALVNNAGYGQRGPVELVPVDQVRRNFETNIFSLIALTQLVIPVMRQQGSGRIVNIGSVAGRIARPYSSIYDSTKHALEAVTDGLRGELARFGIHVTLIRPGIIVTEFIPVANGTIGSLPPHDDLYPRFERERSFSYDMLKHIVGHPRDIARLIVRSLVARRPKARYAGPGHAHALLILRKVLPESLFDLVRRRLG